MENMFLDPMVEENFSVFMMKKPDSKVGIEQGEELLKHLNKMNVKYATVDLGYTELKDFHETRLAELLKKADIPYFTTELPHYVKGYFATEIQEIKNTLSELKGTYDGLKNKNAPSAQELKLLIDRYSTDLRDLDSHITQTIRPDAVVKKIVQLQKGHEDAKWTVLHFGEENTFVEVVKKLKEEGVKINVVFMDISKFL